MNTLIVVYALSLRFIADMKHTQTKFFNPTSSILIEIILKLWATEVCLTWDVTTFIVHALLVEIMDNDANEEDTSYYMR